MMKFADVGGHRGHAHDSSSYHGLTGARVYNAYI